MFSAVKEVRQRGGFPDWERVSHWLDDDVEAEGPGAEKVKSPAIKNTEIRILDNYEVDPEDSFWDNFPRRSLPDSNKSKIKNFHTTKLTRKITLRGYYLCFKIIHISQSYKNIS